MGISCFRPPYWISGSTVRPTMSALAPLKSLTPKTWGSRRSFVSIYSRTQDTPVGNYTPPPRTGNVTIFYWTLGGLQNVQNRPNCQSQQGNATVVNITSLSVNMKVF